MATGNGTGKEIDLTKVGTLAGSDYIRALKDGSSRNITVDNLVTVLNALLSSFLNVVTSETNYLASPGNDVVLMNLAAGPLTATLPSASANEGVLIQIKKIDATTNDLTVQAVSGNIDGSTTLTMSGSGGAKPGAAFISDGSNWYILNA